MAATGDLMLLRLFTLCTLSISPVLFAHATDIVLPRSLVVDLIEQHCSFPEPNPRVDLGLKYDCEDKDDDADSIDPSMKYSLQLLPLIAQDFNRDGVKDVALEIRSSGPMGGSATTNSAVHYLLLDKANRIIEDHQILLYAPFSEHIVEYEVEDNRVRYRAVPNYRSHPEAYNNGGLIEPTIEFDINWIKGFPVSTYYRDNCQLSEETDKQIFTTTRGVKRTVTINIHDYTQVVEENLRIRNVQVSAQLRGCNHKRVSFVFQPNKGSNLPVLADILQTIIPVTSQHQPLTELLKLEQQSKIVFGEVMKLSNDWSARVHIKRDFENASVTINLSQEE